MSDLERIADALERIAVALERQSELPPEALTKEGAARFLGVEVATIEHLIRTRKIEYVQYGSQRGRIIPVDSLRAFLAEYRQEILRLPDKNGRN
jgi:excisionase family DNA binding protein